ncbi:outer membrane beta-barrel protein [Rubrivirga sp. S365]|uniref:outer membrane protein n=1 Tax=Rubrivirga sp. S365 TaxID=3076080 RepID=UPI0028C8A3C3|nr:outer membrane beta-barrel protein [Rubrivirga sp. S365]MDT7856467.1 outer membrane beta-barrel protein [Rubrivirga sp. S365]
MRLPALALCLAAPALAQTDARPAPDDPATWTQTARGVRLLGGSASISRQGDFTTASVAPRVGLFVADGLALGVDLQLSYLRSESSFYTVSGFQESTFSSTVLGVGPSVTYYVGGGRPGIRPFVEADVSLAYQRSSVTTEGISFAPEIGLGGGTNSNFNVGGGLGAGVSIPVARNVALRAQAFYRTFDFEFDDNSSTYGLSAGFTTFLY